VKALIDTNVALRFIDQRHPLFVHVHGALRGLLTARVELFVTQQVLVECWATCTRPLAANGLGLDAASALECVRTVRNAFSLLSDGPNVVAVWLDLCVNCDVKGRQAFDARLAASALAGGIETLVTLHVADFERFHGLHILDPRAR